MLNRIGPGSLLCVTLLTLSPGAAMGQEQLDASATVFTGASVLWGLHSNAGFAVGLGAKDAPFYFEAEISRGPDFVPSASVANSRFATNLVVQPRRRQPWPLRIYGTIGAGLDSWNIGGGVKAPFKGPFRLRIDYRAFMLGDLTGADDTEHRLYLGITAGF